MRIALSIDALSPSLSGIGRYCWELACGLRHDHRVRDVGYFVGQTWIADPATRLVGAARDRHKRDWRQAAEHWWQRRRLANGLIHGPNYFLPEWAESGAVTIHDLSVFKYPDTHPAERVKAFEVGFADTLDRARLVLTDCEWIRREVLDFTGLDPRRVVAVPLGVGTEFRPRRPAELEDFALRYGLVPGGYGLCVSTFEPRKRIGHLIAAWRRLTPDLRTSFPLVLAGGTGWRNEALMMEIARAQAEGWLIYLGYVPETDLPLLYAGARLFAYPSLYEGFGFPPLEAMASGVPAIVSLDTCLEETAGPGATCIDPEDVEDFAQVAARLLTDDAEYARLASAGIQHTSRYRWDECIARTVDAYKMMLEG